MLKNARTTSDKDESIDTAVQHGRLLATDAVEDTQVAVLDWLGFFGESSTRFLDTALIGQIQVRLTMAGNEVLTPKESAVAISTTPTNPNANQISYSLSNFFFTIDSISIDDGVYDMMLRSKIARDGFLSVNFCEYYAFIMDNITSSQQTTRFSVSSQCIDKVYGTMRNSNYQTVGKQAHSFPSNTLGDAFIGNFFRFQSFANNTNFRYGFTINNVNHPQHEASEIEGLAAVGYNENLIGYHSRGNGITTFDEYRDGKFVTSVSLSHPAGCSNDPDLSLLSGIDSRGVNTMMTFTTKALNLAGETASTYVLVQTKATLRCGAGKQLEMIY